MSKQGNLIIRGATILLAVNLVLLIPIFWRAISPTELSVLDCPAAAAAATSAPLTQPKYGLGSRWEVNEGCWRGVYVRRGNSNLFDAEWTLLDGRRFTAEVTLNVQGNRVTGQRRRATLGGDCNLAFGTIGSDGVTVTGRWDCSHPEGAASGCFFARIDGAGGISSHEDELVGEWVGTSGDGQFDEVIYITGGNGQYTVSGKWFDKTTKQQRGGFTATNYRFNGGTLYFRQIMSPKPDPRWSDTNELEFRVEGDTLFIKHLYGSSTLRRKR